MVDLISFRDSRSRAEWLSGNIDPDLAAIFLKAARYANAVLKFQPLITSIFRSKTEDFNLDGTGVHCAWRAIDIYADSWIDTRAAAVADFINTRYIYDPSRPTMSVALFKPHGSGPHVHFQVHPHTSERPPAQRPEVEVA